jgi:hypothetical protein
MRTNQLPAYDPLDNPTGCCPRFHPENWEGVDLHLEGKPFVRASTISLMHVPLNMDAVFRRTHRAIEAAHANQGSYLVLTREDSPWHAEHYFAVDGPVTGADNVTLSGDFVTRVFEGPYSNAGAWSEAMKQLVEGRGKSMIELYFYYTTCPRCAKLYGVNYVVGVARVG